MVMQGSQGVEDSGDIVPVSDEDWLAAHGENPVSDDDDADSPNSGALPEDSELDDADSDEDGDDEDDSTPEFDAEAEFRRLEGSVLSRREMAQVAREIRRELGHVGRVQRDQQNMSGTLEQMAERLESQQQLNDVLIRALAPTLDDADRSALDSLLQKQNTAAAVAEELAKRAPQQDDDEDDADFDDEEGEVYGPDHPDVQEANAAVAAYAEQQGIDMDSFIKGNRAAIRKIELDADGDYLLATDMLKDEIDKAAAASKRSSKRKAQKQAGEKQKGVSRAGGGGVPSLAALAKLADEDAVQDEVRNMNDEQFFRMMQAANQ